MTPGSNHEIRLAEEAMAHTRVIQPEVTDNGFGVWPKHSTMTIEYPSTASYVVYSASPSYYTCGFTSSTLSAEDSWSHNDYRTPDQRRWNRYWTTFLVAKVTPVRNWKPAAAWSSRVNRVCPSMAEQRKKSSIAVQVRRVIRNALKPTGYSHTRRFP